MLVARHTTRRKGSSGPLGSPATKVVKGESESYTLDLRTFDIQLKKLLENVYETINSYYKDFITTNQYCFNLKEIVAEKVDELPRIKKSHDNNENDRSAYFQDVDKVEKTISVVSGYVEIHELFQSFDGILRNGNVKDAANSIVEMASYIEHLISLTPQFSDPTILSIVQEEFIIRKASLIHCLDELYANAFSFQKNGNSTIFQVSQHINGRNARNFYEVPLPLADLLSALSISEMLEKKLSNLSQRILSMIVIPIVQGSVTSLQFSRLKFHATLIAEDSRNSKKDGTPHQQDLGKIGDLLLLLGNFISNHIFEDPPNLEISDSSFTLKFADIWWMDLQHILIEELVKPTIPEDRTLLHKYGDLADQFCELEGRMRAVGMFPQDSHGLSSYVNSIFFHYAQKRRIDLLSKAREILQSDDRNTTQVDDSTERGGLGSLHGHKDAGSAPSKNVYGTGGKAGKEGIEGMDSSFKLPTCSVSVQTQTIVEMAYQSMNEAVKLGGESAKEMFYLTRDLYDLLRAILPIQHEESLIQDPNRSAIFYNDCLYAAHHLLTLGFQYESKMGLSDTTNSNGQGPGTGVITFIDMIPGFKRLGESVFTSQMRRQRDMILAVFRTVEANGSIMSSEDFDGIERLVKEVLYNLEKLVKSWKMVLPQDIYLKSLGLLIDTFISTLIQFILKCPSITDDFAHQIRYALNLTSKMNHWYAFPIKSGKKRKGGESEGHQIQIPFQRYVPSYDKFQLFITFLGYSKSQFEDWINQHSTNELLKKPDIRELVEKYQQSRVHVIDR